MKYALEVEALRACYGRAVAIEKLDLKVEEGTIATVIGPNGAGKSTLLNAIMGSMEDNGVEKATIRYFGESIGRLSVERRVKSGMVLVPETRELFASMTVFENLQLGAYPLYKKKQANYLSELEFVFELFPRLKERYAQRAATLSGGERQMLAVGRALMSRPRLLMLDEPSLGLAPRITQEIFEVISRLRQSGMSTLLIEQNAFAALKVSDYGYVMELGEITLHGTADELRSNPKVIETYLGKKKEKA
jgi:branched-chain amino acid transport system ATP-binding protein